jgi:catechol 2,3-dioxygenase-like lactoylglutathione lyase family enzyme
MTELAVAHVTFDCGDATRLAEFWAALLERPLDPGASEHFATVGRSAGPGPVLMFIQVPDKNPGKNTVHLDLHAPDWPGHVARAVRCGARHVADFEEFGARWTTLADPEGNLFDIGSGM